MEHQFCVLHIRPHLTEENKVLICGFWKKEDRGADNILVSLDYTPVQTDVQEQEVLCAVGVYEKRYFLWTTLPENYREYRKLMVYEREGVHLKKVYEMTTKNLYRLGDKMPMFLDEVLADDRGIQVSGWCIGKDGCQIAVKDAGGRTLPGKLTKRRRPDVEQAYPECEKSWIHGYVFFSPIQVSGKVEITVICGGRQERVRRPVTKTFGLKVCRDIREFGCKVRAYYRQFGFRQTVHRAMEKLKYKDARTYEQFMRKYFPDKRELSRQRKERFAYEPVFSVVTPLYKTPIPYLEAFIRSLQEQTYRKWKVYLSDGSGKDSPIKETLCRFAKEDERIVVIENDEQLQIPENTNRALERAQGDYIVFVDHDDTLAPNAFYECVKVVNERPDAELIYTDSDKLSEDGKSYCEPCFKPDFNLALLHCQNYICHLTVLKKSLFERVGYLEPKYHGVQDYDYILRCVEQTDRIVHIPKILYHWRMCPGSVAVNAENKPYTCELFRQILREHYKRTGIQAEVKGLFPGVARSVYQLPCEPLVSVIIANKDHKKDLERCVESLMQESDYHNIEILIIENNSEMAEIFTYYEQLQKRYSNVRVLQYDREFNYADIQNYAAVRAKGEYLLLLNNDTWLERPESIREMLGYCMQKDVGIVGARLLYPDDTIQHAGVVVGMGGVADHAFVGLDRDEPGYCGRVLCAQEYSAVTAACLLVKKEVYELVGGMDIRFKIAFNDVDFCLRVGEKGYKVIYQPFAVWYHDESKTRGREDTPEKMERFRGEIETFQNRWKDFLQKGDPAYNPNLALDRHDFGLKA